MLSSWDLKLSQHYGCKDTIESGFNYTSLSSTSEEGEEEWIHS